MAEGQAAHYLLKVSYDFQGLTVRSVGQFDLRSYRTAQGLRMYDAVDPDLYGQPADPEDPASPTLGEVADGSLARQGEILDFLSAQFGPYPFSTGGGIVDDAPDLFFALEVQTRSIYPGSSFTDPVDGDLLVVHENAHQWFGDSVALAEWKHMWLNEGFATYAEWLWGEHEDQGARPPLLLGPRRASRRRRRQRPACSSACRTERHLRR